MSFTDKTIASTYGDILQTDNNGSGRSTNGTVIKDGLGQSTALTLGSDKLKITPSSDSTTAVVIANAAGTDLLVVDSTNIPKPDGNDAFAPQLFKVTVDPPTVPFEILTTPEPLAVKVCDKA